MSVKKIRDLSIEQQFEYLQKYSAMCQQSGLLSYTQANNTASRLWANYQNDYARGAVGQCTVKEKTPTSGDFYTRLKMEIDNWCGGILER